MIDKEKLKRKKTTEKKNKLHAKINVDTVLMMLRTAHNTRCKIEIISGERLRIVPIHNIMFLEFTLNKYETKEWKSRKEVIKVSTNYIRVAPETRISSR